MEEKEIVLKREVVFQKSSGELWGVYPWLDLLKEEDKNAWQDDKLDLNIYTDSYTHADSKDIPIKEMKKLIVEAENAGANYIQIDYHCDHEEYDIYGSKITLPEPLEEEKILNKIRISKKMALAGKIRNLQAQIKELKRQQEVI
jgi:hypothetical protein